MHLKGLVGEQAMIKLVAFTLTESNATQHREEGCPLLTLLLVRL